MNVLIFGYGLHGGGFDSAMYFLGRGDNVTVTDIRNREMLGESVDYLEKKGAVIHCGGHMTDDFLWADIVIKSPAIRLENEFLTFSRRTENEFTYVYSCPQAKSIKFICVTGSRNKTTTASAICHCLNALGKKAHMAGNMGISAFSELTRWDNGDVPEYLVLELSAWQARDIYAFMRGHVPHIEVSVITGAYNTQKLNTGDDSFRSGAFNHHANHIVCPSEIKEGIQKLASKKAKNISSFESASRSMSKALPPKMAASFAVLKKLGFNSGAINNALKSFKGIPNRNELVLRTENTLFINDSSSIMPASTNFTMDNFESLPVHLICGGSDSSMDPAPLLSSIRAAASVHLLDGTFTQKKLIPLLKEEGIRFNGPYIQMGEAVSSAISRIDSSSKALQVVLLSPGANAFEHFSNEYFRGESFNEAVRALKA